MQQLTYSADTSYESIDWFMGNFRSSYLLQKLFAVDWEETLVMYSEVEKIGRKWS